MKPAILLIRRPSSAGKAILAQARLCRSSGGASAGSLHIAELRRRVQEDLGPWLGRARSEEVDEFKRGMLQRGHPFGDELEEKIVSGRRLARRCRPRGTCKHEHSRLCPLLAGKRPMPPDLWLVVDGVHRFIEVKLPGDNLRPEQIAGLALIAACLRGDTGLDVALQPAPRGRGARPDSADHSHRPLAG